MIETRPKKTHERALLIGLEKQGVSKWDLKDSLDELAELANSAGAEVVDTVTQKLQKPTAPYYIGKGKAEEIKHSFQDQDVTSVIFDDELSPAQGRNLETLLARKVLDRTQLILDIFPSKSCRISRRPIIFPAVPLTTPIARTSSTTPFLNIVSTRALTRW